MVILLLRHPGAFGLNEHDIRAHIGIRVRDEVPPPGRRAAAQLQRQFHDISSRLTPPILRPLGVGCLAWLRFSCLSRRLRLWVLHLISTGQVRWTEIGVSIGVYVAPLL